MPIITQADLATNIYAEIITEISRSDSTVVTAAINAAVNEAKSYLARFDLLQLFGTDEAQPVVQDEYLKSLVKDIACWHLVRLANPGVDLATYRTAYQDAITALKAIMAGAAQPSGWPYIDTTAETIPPGDSISWQSNPKRNNYY